MRARVMMTATSELEHQPDKGWINGFPWIILPCYNEAANLEKILPELINHGSDFNILVVDDGSEDSTAALCRDLQAGCLQLHGRTGKGHAARKGCDSAAGKGARVIVLMDGDGEHGVEDAVKLVNLLGETEKALLVHGYREKRGNGVFRAGNAVIALVLRLVHGVRLKDPLCGLKAFTAAAYRKIRWETNGYYLEAEIAVNAKHAGVLQREMRIKTANRKKIKGTTPLTGVMIIQEALRQKIRLYRKE